MLKQRIFSALILIVLVSVALFGFSPFYFALALGGVVVLALWEWTQFPKLSLSALRGVIPAIGATFLFLWIYSEAHYLAVGRVFRHSAELWLLLATLWWLVATGLVAFYPKSLANWGRSIIAQLVFAVVTLIPFFVGVLALRLSQYTLDPYHGVVLLLYVFVLVWAADSGAYFAGRKFGKHKLAPRVSPGKTWEGVFGGLMSAALFAWLFLQFTQINGALPLGKFILLSVATVAISIVGDLTESMFKREAGIKDSSQLIPGHGGILDRIDSLTAAVPFFSYFYFFVL